MITRVGLYGAGDIADLHAAGIQECEGAQLVGLFDIDNKTIKRLWIEEGFGDNTTGDSYGKSSPENILKDLKQL